MIRDLEDLRESLPISPKELVSRCRESDDLSAIAVSLRLDRRVIGVVSRSDLARSESELLAIFGVRAQPREAVR